MKLKNDNNSRNQIFFSMTDKILNPLYRSTFNMIWFERLIQIYDKNVMQPIEIIDLENLEGIIWSPIEVIYER